MGQLNHRGKIKEIGDLTVSDLDPSAKCSVDIVSNY